MNKIILSFLFFLLQALSLFAQNLNETGKPIISTYRSIDVGLNYQVWSFVEDSRGIIYVGSSPGVFEFDGSSWRSIPVANNTFCRSIAIDKNNRIYVGASGDFGYLASDDNGELKYISLLNLVKEEDRTLTYIWTTKVTDEGIYFQSLERIFRFTPGKTPNTWNIKVWKPRVRFNYAFWVDDTYYVQQGGVGLMKMVGDSLVLLPGGEQFANDRLQVMLPYTKNNKKLLLVGTFNTGLYLFDGKSFQSFKCEADAFVRQSTLYGGQLLGSDSYALITLDGGMIVMDKEGKIKLLLNRRTGISSNSVTALFVDSKGLIWLAPEASVSIVEYPSAITMFDESLGQISSILGIKRYKDKLYLAETNGVFYLDNATSTIRELSGFDAGNNQSFQLTIIKDQLLVAHGTGLYRINDLQVERIRGASGTDFIPQYIHQSMKDSNRIFVGLIDGLCSFYYDKHKSTGSHGWVFEGRINLGDYVITMAEEKPGILWLSTNSSGVYTLNFNKSSHNKPEIKRFSTAQGVPPGGRLSL